MITGRNERCPCGSGKKYKKCCLQADPRIDQDEIVGADREPMQNDKSARIAGLDIHPYAIVRMVMNPTADVLSRLSKRDIAALKDRWSIARMAQLDTTEIVSRLHDLGIDGTKSVFLPLAEGRMSAWSIGETWSDGLARSPARDDEDFICLAACELWKRHCPERPSMEMVDDWIAEGYDRTEAGENGKAADVWLRVWDVIRSRIQPSMATFEAADAVFKVTQNFNNWIQDFETALENAAVGNRNYADIGIRLTRSVLAQFVDENMDTLLNFRCDLGRFLFLADRCDEGENILQAVIRAHPEKACGYVVLSDELETHARGRSDYSRAIALLEQALSYPVKNADEWDIDKRLADLRSKMPGDARKNAQQTGNESTSQGATE